MHQNENGEVVMSRREYGQLMAAVPASHATGDDGGFFSGLFGSSDSDGGPGFFEDMEIRHEDEHVIMDPEVIDFMGASLEVEKPNEYDNAVRIRVAGDVAVEGEDIAPKSVDAQTVRTDKLQHGADVTDDLEKKSISPDVSDVGAAVNTAINELAPEGGIIELPKGNNTFSTTVDLSDGTNNQESDTPLIFVGHGRTRQNNNAEGTFLDATNLSGSAFTKSNTRKNLVFRDFTVYNPPTGSDTFDLTGGNARELRMENVMVDGNGGGGSNFAFNIAAAYGGVIDHIYALDFDRGVRLDDCNAAEIGTIQARENNDANPAVVIKDSTGFDCGSLYIESNEGSALALTGTCNGFSIGSIYLEGNNQGNGSSREVILGDTSITAGTVSDAEINAMKFASAANSFGNQRFTWDDVTRVGISGIRGSPDIHATSQRGNEMTVMNSQVGEADTKNVSTPGVWVHCSIGTDNRGDGHVDLSGGDLTLTRSFATINLGPNNDIQLKYVDSDNSYRVRDSGGNDILIFGQDQGVQNVGGGPSNAGVYKFNNARIYEDSNGEIVAEDSAGNTTQLT